MADNETIIERELAMLATAEASTEKLRQIVHGDENTEVVVDSGVLPTLKKWMKDSAAFLTDIVQKGDLQGATDPLKGAGLVGRSAVAVQTIADLLALPAGARKYDQRYIVASYHGGWAVEVPYIGPSGGGEFVWDPACTLADNGGTVLAVSGVTTGRFLRLTKEFVDADFGVRGDGTDESTKWQKLLSSVPTAGVVVLTKRARVQALTCNADSAVFTARSASYIDSPALLLHAASTIPLLTVGGFGWKIEAGAFEDPGVDFGAVNFGSVAIRFQRSNGARDVDAAVSGSTLFRKFDRALHIVGINTRVTDSLFSHCLRPIYVDQVGSEIVRGIRVNGNRFHGRIADMLDYCVTINGSSHSEIQVCDNIADGVAGFYKGPLSRRSSVSDNQVATPATDAFVFMGGAYGRADGNTVGGGQGHGMILDGCTSPTIDGATIDSMRMGGILLRRCTNWKVRSPDITNVNTNYAADGNIYDGILIESTCSVGELDTAHVRQLIPTSGRYGINNLGNQTIFSGNNVAMNFAVGNFNQSTTQRAYGNTGVMSNKQREDYGTAPPAAGTWGLGDKIWNTSTVAGTFIGWVCVSPGSPGIWKGFGVIEST